MNDKIRHQILKTELGDIITQLKKKYRPEKVIVFGSFAQNQTGKWSDLDIAVVKDTNKRFIDRLKEVAGLIDTDRGVDFLVYTPSEFRRMAQDNYFVRNEIVAKGRVVYDKNQSG